jgi:hypothetical protein
MSNKPRIRKFRKLGKHSSDTGDPDPPHHKEGEPILQCQSVIRFLPQFMLTLPASWPSAVCTSPAPADRPGSSNLLVELS